MQSIINNIRTLLFLLTICAILTLVTWNQSTPYINKIDNLIIKKYENYYKDRFSKIESSFNKNTPETSIRLLNNFYHDIEHIKKNDRLDPLKRDFFKIITKILIQLNKYENAWIWFEKWIEFDAKDLYAQAGQAELLFRMQGHREEGLQRINLLQKKLRSKIVVDTYSRMLTSQNQIADTVTLRNKYNKSNCDYLNYNWIIYFNTGNGFNSQQNIIPEIRMHEPDWFSFSVFIENAAKSIRIYSPSNIALTINNPVICFIHESKKTEIKLTKKNTRGKDMIYLKENQLRTFGPDAYMTIVIPEEFRKDEVIAFFRAETGIKVLQNQTNGIPIKQDNHLVN